MTSEWRIRVREVLPLSAWPVTVRRSVPPKFELPRALNSGYVIQRRSKRWRLPPLLNAAAVYLPNVFALLQTHGGNPLPKPRYPLASLRGEILPEIVTSTPRPLSYVVTLTA